jgi:phosphate transport system substrate-binding protein
MRARASILVTLTGALFAAAAAGAAPELPDYRPQQQVTGVLRSWGDNHMAALLKNWEQGFHQYQPGVYFVDNLRGTASGPFGLFENVADFALMGREIFTYEYYGIYRRSLMVPVEIAVATGSYDVPQKSFALTVFVHRDNPLARLTLAQLDGIFGDARTGGWLGLNWNREAARGAEKNIRTWGQLGLTGAWADLPIHLYGPPGVYPGGQTFFQRRVMGGADTWAEGLREYADPAKMMADLSSDPQGIAYTGMGYRTALTKPLAVAETDAGPFVEPTRASVASRDYPLSRLVYLCFAPDQPSGDPADPRVDPKLREFLRYILSRQGQADVAREGDYLPLTPAVASEQLRQIDQGAALAPTRD